MQVFTWIYMSFAIIALVIWGVVFGVSQSVLTLQIAGGILAIALFMNTGLLVVLLVKQKRLLRLMEETAQLHAATQLPNRIVSLHTLNAQIRAAQRHGYPIGVMIIDIDDFKDINNRFGLAGGDVILKQAAEVIRKECRESDLVGHFTGDRFIVASPHSDREGSISLAQRIHRAFSQGTFVSRGGQTTLTVCIGIAASPPHAMDADELVHQASTSLRSAKKQGKNRMVC